MISISLRKNNNIYACVTIFIVSVIYSVSDIYVGDKFYSEDQYFIAITYFFLYKVIPSIFVGNISYNLIRGNSDFFLSCINLLLIILFVPTFFLVKLKFAQTSYIFHVLREIYIFLIIITIFINIKLNKYTIISLLNIISGLYIFNSKIFLLYVLLMIYHQYVKNKTSATYLSAILVAISVIYVLYTIKTGYGRDSEISFIAYTIYSVEIYGRYTGDFINNLIIQATVPNFIYQLIFDDDKQFISLDKIFSNFYGYPIEDYNTNPVIPFIFAYGKIGIAFFLFLYYSYIILIMYYVRRNSNIIISAFLYVSLLYIIFAIELDFIILSQFIKFQLMLVSFNILYKYFGHVIDSKYTSNSVL